MNIHEGKFGNMFFKKTLIKYMLTAQVGHSSVKKVLKESLLVT